MKLLAVNISSKVSSIDVTSRLATNSLTLGVFTGHVHITPHIECWSWSVAGDENRVGTHSWLFATLSPTQLVQAWHWEVKLWHRVGRLCW
jgi:hypothetical protein